MNRKLYLLLLLAFPCANNYAARYEVAAYNYEQKKYDIALEQFLELAELGNKDAQYAIGLIHLKGFNTPKNHILAYAWFKIASSKGNQNATDIYKNLYSLMSDAQKKKSDETFENLNAKYGDKAVEDKLLPKVAPERTIKSDIIPIRVAQPIYPPKAARRGISGDATVQFDIGKDGRAKNIEILNYTHNYFVYPAIEAAQKITYAVVKVDDKPVALNDVQFRFMFKIAGTKNNEEGVFNYLQEMKQKATKGTSVDRYQYAQSIDILSQYLNPDKLSTLDSSIEWYSKAAIDGLPQAKLKLGRMSYIGDQCEQEVSKSYFWMESAARDGLPEALIFMGLKDIESGELESVKKGLEKLKQAADEDHALGKIEYSKALAYPPKGIKPDIETAIKYISSIDAKKYNDPLTLYETQYLIYRAAKDKKNAEKTLKHLKKYVIRFKYPWDRFEANLERQIKGQEVLPLIVNNT